MPDQTTWNVLKQLVQDLGEVLGDRCEVVLHDVTVPEHSIVAIANGHVTGRKVGDSIPLRALPALKDVSRARSRIRYRTHSPKGAPMTSSSLALRDADGKVFAALCINWDVGAYLAAAQVMNDFAMVKEEVEEQFVPDMRDVLDQVIQEALAA